MPKSITSFVVVFAFLLFLFFPMMYVFANQVQTTMTWFVPNNRNHTIAYGATCSSTAFFFDENSALVDGDIDGNGAQITPKVARGSSATACQDGTSLAAMTITNAGNTTINIDANFGGDLDTNIWLKVWQSNGVHCGTNGMGGWAQRCTLNGSIDTTTAVGVTTCRDFNSTNDQILARLVTNLPVNDTNKLCFSGDFLPAIASQAAAVAAGDHNGTFQTWSGSNG